MKTLKFTADQIPQIIAGVQTTTWRIDDEKQLDVGDEIQFINSQSGASFGYGRIREITKKRIVDIDEHDKVGHKVYRNDAEILAEFRKFYGPEVTTNTIVKVVKYTYNKHKQHINDVKKSTQFTEVKLFTDGGSRGNPGPSATGIVILDMDDNVVTNTGKYLGITTNNQAEYQAVLQGLVLTQELGARVVHVYMDSLLVVNQMIGIFKIKNRELWPIHQAIKESVESFKKVSFTHVPREMNRQADAEVNRILDAQEKSGLSSELL
jgi:ribonuclease HI